MSMARADEPEVPGMAGASSPVRVEVEDGVAHLVLDAPGRSVNVMDDAYGAAMEAAVKRLRRLLEGSPGTVRGVVVRSAKRTFFAGGDVEAMVARPATPEAWRWRLEQVQRPLRALETCGVPVVAAVNGAAMGGGLEIALAAHRRVAVLGDYPLGLPEVTLGVIAAGGGVSRTVRMLGLATALEDVLLSGRTYRPGEALALGLIDEVVSDPDDLLPAALSWLEDAAADPQAAIQVWDRPGFRVPTTSSQAQATRHLRRLEERTAYAIPEAPRAVLRAAVMGAPLDFDASGRLEVEQFLHLAVRPEFAVTLRAAFLDRREVARNRAVPASLTAPGTDVAGVRDRGPAFVARLDAALSREVAWLEADGVRHEHVAATRALLGLAGWGPADRLARGMDREVADRLLFALSDEAVEALQDGTVTSVAEANVLSIDGIGFPTVLGGAIGHVLHHVEDGTQTGLEGFLRRSQGLAAAHGPRFELSRTQTTFLRRLTEQESLP
jgi:enoyl-CoA hydratase/carnithine racemase